MMKRPINLISDTVTKPTPPMLEAMMKAEVGDDVFQADPTVRMLEEKAADMFGKEAALFCPSGTMTNQIAIQGHVGRLEAVICDHYSHVYQYETGGYSYNARAGIKLIKGTNGKFTAAQLEEALTPQYDWLPDDRLVVVENTCNKGGGSIYTLPEIEPIRAVCDQKGLSLHLDGARLFNALVETGEDTQAVGGVFDSISICISKGLGAPVGSVLIGDRAFIRKARRLRKVMGGGMRQAGFLAAACIYALDHQVDRLKEDNKLAKQLGAFVSELPFVESVRPVQSNIVIFDLKAPLKAAPVLSFLEAHQILASPFGPSTIRFVTHLDLPEDTLGQVQQVLEKFTADVEG